MWNQKNKLSRLLVLLPVLFLAGFSTINAQSHLAIKVVGEPMKDKPSCAISKLAETREIPLNGTYSKTLQELWKETRAEFADKSTYCCLNVGLVKPTEVVIIYNYTHKVGSCEERGVDFQVGKTYQEARDGIAKRSKNLGRKNIVEVQSWPESAQ